MNSCLYIANIMHHRLEPKKHRFNYNVFMFYVDLDELALLQNKFSLISHDRFNAFSFRTKDHLQLARKSTKENILEHLAQNNIKLQNPRVMLLTNFAVFGYQFNPVSFYFCYNGEELICSIVEVGNTFGEIKPYILKKEHLTIEGFHLRTTKYFYVSPFIEHDADFDFNIKVPDEKINIRIDDYKGDKRIFLSTLTGVKRELTNTRLWWYAFRFPFLTLKVISLIHWNALLLWLKKIKYYKKEEFPELQQGVHKRNP